MGVVFEYSDLGSFIECNNKKECFDFIAEYVKKNPGMRRYRFSASEKINIEKMILDYTINGAKQLGIDSSKVSNEVGKDADYLVFKENLLYTPPEGLSKKKLPKFI